MSSLSGEGRVITLGAHFRVMVKNADAKAHRLDSHPNSTTDQPYD
jgi:hypothetical protein